ncbi:DUF6119 family protein [Amycolatopsis sp. Hca4]|uniref:DUF6119 family protein n=1 Tax=Amycolatopsis sp. Hca4 TaxID=2742131 RepID=UPI0034CDE77C
MNPGDDPICQAGRTDRRRSGPGGAGASRPRSGVSRSASDHCASPGPRKRRSGLWFAGRTVEGNYNLHVAKAPLFLCLDKKLVTSRAHPHGIEACDLLGPDNELVHVKKFSSKTGSSVLSHLFAQGLVAIETFLGNSKTWDEFRTKVAEQDPSRAAKLGPRPAALVYAIHRSDRPLNPATLFTFARSALVSASIALSAYGIPLQVCVIP